MKRILSFVLVLALLVSNVVLFSKINSEAATDSYSGYMENCGFTWRIDRETRTLTISGEGVMHIGSADYPAWTAYYSDFDYVVVEEGITSLDDHCFYNLTIKKLTLPSSLEVVRETALYDAEVFEIEIPQKNNLRRFENYSSASVDFRSTSWFTNQPDGCVYLGDFLLWYKGTAPADTVVEIKEGTRAINVKAFYGQKGITDFIFCDGIERIGNSAFQNTGWFDKQPNNSLIYIGNVLHTIKGTSYASKLTVKEGTVSISPYAFSNKERYGYIRYKTVEIPSSVKYIDEGAFAQNSLYFEKVIFADNSKLELIDSYAFYSCPKLVPHIPDGVKLIGEYAFCYSTGENTPPDLSIPASVEFIDYMAFHGCLFNKYIVDEHNTNYSNDKNGILFNKDKSVLISVPSAIDMEEYEIDAAVIRIEHHSFYDNETLKTIRIPDTVTEIGYYAFGSSAIENIELAYGLKRIPTYAFSRCDNLLSFVVPRSVEVIEKNAFYNSEIYDIYVPRETEYIGEYLSNNLFLVMHCYGGTVAETYATQKSWKIEYIDDPDISKLTELLNEYRNLNRKNYVEESLASLDEAVAQVDLVTVYYTAEQVAEWKYKISEAFEKIELLPADYSEISEMIQRAYSIDRSLYTTESLAVLDKAVEAVESDIGIDEQNRVDKFAYDIANALFSLKYLPANYDSVYCAIEESKKIDRRLYSQESLTVLDQSISSVNYDLNITEQDKVENYAQRIYSSLDALEYANVILRNEPHGVVVSATTKELDPDTALTADLKDSSDLHSGNFAVGGTVKSITLYDINLLLNAEKIQPDGFVTVKIKLPEGVDPNRCKVYHIIDDPVDPLVRYATTLEGNFIVFETDHFSEFAVIEVETVLSGVSITRMPSKLTYTLNEKVDLTDIEVTALLSDGISQTITDYDVSSVDTSSVGTKTVTVYYTFGEITKSASFEITVSADKLSANIICGGEDVTEINRKVKWYMPYSSESLKLDCNLSVPGNYKIQWSADNHKVTVDSDGNVTNKGFFFPRKATVTATVLDSAGNVVAQDSVTVRFYKFSFQLTNIMSKTIANFVFGKRIF